MGCSRVRATSLAVTAAAAATLGLGACSGDGATPGVSPSSSAASSSTSPSSTSPSSTSPSSTSPSSTSSSQSAQSGSPVDGKALARRLTTAVRKAGSGHLVLRSNGSRIGHGDFDTTGDGRAKMVLDAGPRTVTTIQIGRTVYVKGLQSGKQPWLRVDPGGSNPLSKMLGSLGSHGDDPARTAKVLAGADVTSAGTARVGGERVHLYRATVPAKSYADVLGPRLGRALATALDGPVRIRYAVDDTDRPVRVTTRMKVSGKQQVSQVDYSDWGTPVEVSAPPKDQVTSADSLSQQAS